jgi:hypothetical protein
MKKELGSCLVLGTFLFAGCCQTVPVVPRVQGCEINEELLKKECSSPRPLPGDATFSQLVDTMQSDRQALRECAISLTAVRNSMIRCNQEIESFNRQAERMNRAN